LRIQLRNDNVRALADAIDRLYAARRLSARWHLVLTHSDAANPDTTFSLEPEPAADGFLSALQGDLRVLAGELARQFALACDALQAQVR
jgi:3'-phosphoadenosine 5'-phosphosulfate sulfotransferase